LIDLCDRRLIDPGGIVERPDQGSPLPRTRRFPPIPPVARTSSARTSSARTPSTTTASATTSSPMRSGRSGAAAG